jgi:hypothetical protein
LHENAVRERAPDPGVAARCGSGFALGRDLGNAHSAGRVSQTGGPPEKCFAVTKPFLSHGRWQAMQAIAALTRGIAPDQRPGASGACHGDE